MIDDQIRIAMQEELMAATEAQQRAEADLRALYDSLNTTLERRDDAAAMVAALTRILEPKDPADTSNKFRTFGEES